MSELETRVLRALHTIAPELDTAALPRDADLRDAADLDSMDFLRLVIALEGELQIPIPEAAYPQIRSVRGLVEYLETHRAG